MMNEDFFRSVDFESDVGISDDEVTDEVWYDWDGNVLEENHYGSEFD